MCTMHYSYFHVVGTVYRCVCIILHSIGCSILAIYRGTRRLFEISISRFRCTKYTDFGFFETRRDSNVDGGVLNSTYV